MKIPLFITAKGKEFYRQLTERKYVAISGMTGGGGSLSKKAISIRGEVKELGAGLVDRYLKKILIWLRYILIRRAAWP